MQFIATLIVFVIWMALFYPSTPKSSSYSANRYYGRKARRMGRRMFR